MEFLTKSINVWKTGCNIKAPSLGKEIPKISSIFYIDDIFIFYQGTPIKIKYLVTTVKHLIEGSMMHVNHVKNKIIIFNLSSN